MEKNSLIRLTLQVMTAVITVMTAVGKEQSISMAGLIKKRDRVPLQKRIWRNR